MKGQLNPKTHTPGRGSDLVGEGPIRSTGAIWVELPSAFSPGNMPDAITPPWRTAVNYILVIAVKMS